MPTGFADIGLSELYASGKRIADLVALALNETLDVYATPMFSAEEVSETRARFKSESSTYVEGDFSPAVNALRSLGLRHVYHKAEGKVVLLFTGHAGKDE